MQGELHSFLGKRRVLVVGFIVAALSAFAAFLKYAFLFARLDSTT